MDERVVVVKVRVLLDQHEHAGDDACVIAASAAPCHCAGQRARRAAGNGRVPAAPVL